MCNLYNVTTTQEAIRQIARVARDRAGNLEPSLNVYPNYDAPVVRLNGEGERELVRLRWGMPTPPAFVKGKADRGVTNIRNVGSPHWRRWLGPESRCLVPMTRFAEPSPTKDADGKTPNVWFELAGEEKLCCFAGLWTPWHGVRKVKDGPADFELFGFLTTSPNGVVEPVHKKAMPVILTTADEFGTWLTAPWAEAKALQRPLPDAMLTIAEQGARPD